MSTSLPFTVRAYRVPHSGEEQYPIMHIMSARRRHVLGRCEYAGCHDSPGLACPRLRMPEGRICRQRYQRATRIHGACISCGTAPLARTHRRRTSMRGLRRHPKDFQRTQRGAKDEPVRRGLCAHWRLTDDLSGLLAGDDGDISPIVRPLFDAQRRLSLEAPRYGSPSIPLQRLTVPRDRRHAAHA